MQGKPTGESFARVHLRDSQIESLVSRLSRVGQLVHGERMPTRDDTQWQGWAGPGCIATRINLARSREYVCTHVSYNGRVG